MQYIWILLISIVIYRISMRLAYRYRILDKPGPDVPKRKPVPTLLWLVAFLIPLAIVLLMRPEDILAWSGPFFWLRVWLFAIVVVTAIDELWRIVSPKLRVWPIPRLLVQLSAIGFAAVVSGVWISEFQWINGTIIEFWPLTSFLLTVWWFLLFINAINWFDGIYGLATGMSSIWFLTIAALLSLVVIPAFPDISQTMLTLLQDVSWYAMVFFIVTALGTIIEFRPWWLMRDVWTMGFWFVLAYLALLWWAKIWTIIVVLMFPLFDAVWVIIDRVHRRRKNPLYGDFTHLHYRLMALGRNRNEVRVFIWWLSLFFVVLMLLQGVDRVWKLIIFVMVACIFFWVNWYLYRKKWLEAEYDRKKFSANAWASQTTWATWSAESTWASQSADSEWDQNE